VSQWACGIPRNSFLSSVLERKEILNARIACVTVALITRIV